MVIEKPRVVVGLQLGTKFSGFSHVYVTAPKVVLTCYEYPKCNGERPYCKTLAASYYKNFGPGNQWQFQSWGYIARFEYERDLSALSKARERGLRYDQIRLVVGTYVRGFMEHFANIEQGASSTLDLPQGLTLDEVVMDYLRAMGALILETMQKHYGPQLTMRDIVWCVAIPSTWGSVAKTRMKNCMVGAGLSKGVDGSPHQIIMVLEIEAASTYALEVLKRDLMVGDKILTTDIGNEMSHMVVLEVVSVGNVPRRMKEVTTSSRNFGYNLSMDDRFMELLHNKLGPCLEECIKKYPSVYTFLIKDWESEKICFGTKAPVEINLPHKLVREWENWDEMMGNPKRDSYDELEISYEEIQSIFDPIIDQNLHLMACLLDEEATIKVFVVVGDLARIPYVIDRIQQRFDKIVTLIIYRFNPESIVINGSALLAMQIQDFELRSTRFVNETDCEFQINYNGDAYTIDPKSSNCVSWFLSDSNGTLVPEISLRGIHLASNICLDHLYGNKEIIIFKGVDNAYHIQSFTECVRAKYCSMVEFLIKMERLLDKVKIWRIQCEHLMKQYWRVVAIVRQDLAKEPPMDVENWSNVVHFLCSNIIYCMLEGEALLHFCSGRENRVEVVFALSSPPPFVPTFSRFGVVLRELEWIFDFSLFLGQCRGDIVFDDWMWCEKQCRMAFNHGGIAGMKLDDMKDEPLEADASRQKDDREALKAFMNREEFWIGVDFKSKLKAIWNKRLLPSSSPHKTNLIQDCFYLDGAADFKYVDHLSQGASKVVNKNKWLGATVAVAIVTNIPISILEAEASLLARVQHPNVVELMGYTHEEGELYNSKGYLVTELMEQDLESLIRYQQRHTMGGPPFALSVAVDMASQIVEAMIHLKECRVIHRDLKPGNCLVRPKFQKGAWQGYDHMYYCVKLTDFGTSKLRGEDSYFHTRKVGTPSYMAPELYGLPEEKWPYTWSADVYSFGMTCYKIFTGKAPFETKRLRDISAMVCGGERPSFPLEFPRAVQGLIEKCWVRDPRARPTFKDIRKELWEFKSKVMPLMVHRFFE